MAELADSPLVSIIVRTKDRPTLLRRALQSIAAQDYRPIEVVLVNDGGCELDVEDLKTILGDVSLNYHRLEQNTGRAHAGNVGVGNAQGEYVGFLDDDDEFYPDHVETLVAFLQGRIDYVGAYTDSRLLQREYDCQGVVITESDRGVFRSWGFSHEVLLFENFIPLHCNLLQKRVITEVGGFDETLEIFEDWDLIIRATRGRRFSHIPKVTAKYIHWSKTEQIAFVDWPNARDYYLKVLAKHSGEVTPEVIYAYYVHTQEYMNKSVLALEEEIKETRRDRDEKEMEVRGLKEGLERKDQEIFALKGALRERNAYIEEVHNSFGWKLLHVYRTRIRARMFPAATKRERLYRLILKGLLTLHGEGIRFAFGKTLGKIKRRLAQARIKRETFSFPVFDTGLPKTVHRKISVVIPTKNAGGEFKNTLEKIRNQTGIADSEIIIVDSGSQDDTLLMARRYGATVLSIKPEEFNHGTARNLGAEKATGDYLFFLSQDVIPITDRCFHNVVSVMETDSGIAAATVKQIPRSDGDLFTCWQLWYYYTKLLELSDDRIVCASPHTLSQLSPLDKRKVSQVDNICSCIRKDIFDRFKFRPLSYAEDLDLGLRLISGGYKIAFLSSVGAIHSHNRNAAYYFRRSFVDVAHLIRLLEYEAIRWEDFGIASTEDMLSAVHSFYGRINATVKVLQGSDFRQPGSSFFTTVRACLRDAELKANGKGEESLDELLGEMGKAHSNKAITFDDTILGNQYLGLVDSFEEYMCPSIDMTEQKDEAASALYKFFSVIAGSSMGNFAMHLERKNRSEATMEMVSRILGQGV